MNDRTERTPLPTPAERVAALVAGRLDDPESRDHAVAALRELARLVRDGDR